MNKLSFVKGEIFYHKDDINIPENQSTQNYVNDLIKKLLKTEPTKFLSHLYITFSDGTCFYMFDNGKIENQIRRYCPIEDINKFQVSPNLIDLHNLGTQNEIKYSEIDLLQIHPEMLNFLPINSEEKVKQYLNFLINILNINFHPDDTFENYFNDDNEIIDSKGNTIFIEPFITDDWFDFLTKTCINIMGYDNFCELGLEIMLKNIHSGKFVPEKEQQSFKTIDADLINELKSGELKNIMLDIQQTHINITVWLYENISDNFQKYFSNKYPYSTSFDELKINKWCGRITGKFKLIPVNVSILEELNNWFLSLQHLKNFWEGFQTTASEQYCKVFEDLVFNKDFYPFDDVFEKVVTETEMWSINLIKNLKKSGILNQYKDGIPYDVFDTAPDGTLNSSNNNNNNTVKDSFEDSENKSPIVPKKNKRYIVINKINGENSKFPSDMDFETGEKITIKSINKKTFTIKGVCELYPNEPYFFDYDTFIESVIEDEEDDEEITDLDDDINNGKFLTDDDLMESATVDIDLQVKKEAKKQGLKYKMGKFYNDNNQEVKAIFIKNKGISFQQISKN